MKVILYILIFLITPIFLYYMYLLCNLSVEHLDKPEKWIFINYFNEHITAIFLGGVLCFLVKYLNDRSE